VEPPEVQAGVRIFPDIRVPRADVRAAVVAVQHRCGKTLQVDGVAGKDVFLAGPGLYQKRRNPLRAAPEIFLDDFPRSGLWTHVQGDREAQERRVLSPAQADRRTEDAVIGKAADAGEKWGRRAQLVRAAEHGADLEDRLYLIVGSLDFAFVF